MRRYRLLKGYALLLGAGLLVLGALGALPLPPHPEHPEYLLHIGSGGLFVAGALLLDDLGHLRGFVGALGASLVAAKAVIVVARASGADAFAMPGAGYVCLVAGVCSLLVALLVGDTRGR